MASRGTELIERYARAIAAATCRQIRFYEVFALFKIAVVIQQIFFRYARGQTTMRGSRRSTSASHFSHDRVSARGLIEPMWRRSSDLPPTHIFTTILPTFPPRINR